MKALLFGMILTSSIAVQANINCSGGASVIQDGDQVSITAGKFQGTATIESIEGSSVSLDVKSSNSANFLKAELENDDDDSSLTIISDNGQDSFELNCN